MEPFRTHTGIGVPLRRSNVDTDQIIPAVYLKRVTRTGFEDGLFASWRNDPSFVLNLSPFDKGSVLVAGPDFGTGSSREHAVWALTDFGIRCIIAPSFGDIFAGNARKNGLLLIRLPDELCARLRDEIALAQYAPIEVDLEAEQIRLASGEAIDFQIDPDDRRILMEGLDDIARTLRHADAIARFEAAF